MILLTDCGAAQDLICDYVDGALAVERRAALEAHLRNCPACREESLKYQGVHQLLQGTLKPMKTTAEFHQETSKRLAAIGSGLAPSHVRRISTRVPAPEEEAGGPGEAVQAEEPASTLGGWATAQLSWWLVSTVLHGLMILLIGLVTMAVKEQDTGGEVVVTTELAASRELAPEPEKPKTDALAALEAKQETPATDPDSQLQSDIVVPPDILAKAELGDHFETINPDRPDTHSAFGNPDAHMFHSEQGSDDAAGGGGVGGLTLDEVIGVGGGGSPGTGGGWGGGHGTGVGVDKGSGRGSFGQRSGGGRRLMVMRHGGSKATESSVDLGLEWLVRHQEKDGSWDTDKYMDNKNGRHGFNPVWPTKYDAGITGLATLAFLGAGHSTKVGKYKGTVQAAISWLLSQQGADGDFTSKVKPCDANVTMYCHCIATLACAEALAMSGLNPGEGDYYGEGKGKGGGLAAAVAKAVELILEWQKLNAHGGWSYAFSGPTVVGPLDPTATGWAVMALKSAKVAKIPVPVEALKRASDGVLSLTQVDANKNDYGWASTNYRGMGNMFGSKGYACTAAGAVSQLFLGVDVMDPKVAGAVAYITQEDALPQWIFTPANAAADHQNLYYWYYGTLASFQYGGDAWKRWNEKMKAALVPNQRRGGAKDGSPQDVDGSWDPSDVWGAWGGRVYSTALAALCLEVYYRYLPMYR